MLTMRYCSKVILFRMRHQKIEETVPLHKRRPQRRRKAVLVVSFKIVKVITMYGGKLTGKETLARYCILNEFVGLGFVGIIVLIHRF